MLSEAADDGRDRPGDALGDGELTTQGAQPTNEGKWRHCGKRNWSIYPTGKGKVARCTECRAPSSKPRPPAEPVPVQAGGMRHGAGCMLGR